MEVVNMGLFKKGAIKRTTKKRTWQIIKALDQFMSSEDNTSKTPEELIKSALLEFIKYSSMANSFYSPPHFTFHFAFDLNDEPWEYILLHMIIQLVYVELSYDPSIGSKEDVELIAKTFYAEISKFS
jgi:hypothetical protein